MTQISVAEETDETKPLSRRVAYVGAVVLPASIAILASVGGGELGFGEFTNPGPGMWPSLLGYTLGTLVLILCLRPGIVVSHTETASAADLGRVGIAVVALGLFYVGFAYFGVIPAVIASLLFWLRVLSKQGWLSALLISVTTGVVVLLVFTRLLELPLSAFGRPL